jgi:hypothetical protein
VFWSKDILFFEAAGIGAKVEIPFDAPEDGRYELIAQVAGAPDYGSYLVLVDGKSPTSATELEHEPGANVGLGPSFDGYYTELFVGEDRIIGRPRLTKGRHTVTFVCTGKNASSSNYFLGVDALVLARVAGDGPAVADSASNLVRSDRLRAIGELGSVGGGRVGELVAGLRGGTVEERVAAAWSLTQVGRAARSALGALTEALGDSDHVVRGLAAAALRDAGPLDQATVRALAERLSDRDDGVRMMSAWALAGQGAGALIVFDDLVTAGRQEGQHPHVQRAVADAFGAIGPAAKGAIPVLERLRLVPRVRWNADRAIGRIRSPA